MAASRLPHGLSFATPAHGLYCGTQQLLPTAQSLPQTCQPSLLLLWCPCIVQHIPKYCGSCFLHATLSMVADRLKIAKGGKAPDVMLGRQTFL